MYPKKVQTLFLKRMGVNKMGMPTRPSQVNLGVTQLPMRAPVGDGARSVVNSRLRQEANDVNNVTTVSSGSEGGLGPRAKR